MNWPRAGRWRKSCVIEKLLLAGALVLPFFALQLINRRAFQEEFPVVLFVFMSVHALLIVFLLAPAVRRISATRSIAGLSVAHWAGLVFGILLVGIYASVVRDQLPCFLGVPNCD
jgi:hypothetical protein